jgi:hypothetical protein
MAQSNATQLARHASSGVNRRARRWRRATGREVAVAVVVKLAALALLWWLCFSPAHRVAADAGSTGRQLGLEQHAAVAGTPR